MNTHEAIQGIKSHEQAPESKSPIFSKNPKFPELKEIKLKIENLPFDEIEIRN